MFRQLLLIELFVVSPLLFAAMSFSVSVIVCLLSDQTSQLHRFLKIPAHHHFGVTSTYGTSMALFP